MKGAVYKEWPEYQALPEREQGAFDILAKQIVGALNKLPDHLEDPTMCLLIAGQLSTSAAWLQHRLSSMGIPKGDAPREGVRPDSEDRALIRAEVDDDLTVRYLAETVPKIVKAAIMQHGRAKPEPEPEDNSED